MRINFGPNQCFQNFKGENAMISGEIKSLNPKKKSLPGLMVKSVCGYTIFYQTDSNVLPSMEQHQVKLK